MGATIQGRAFTRSSGSKDSVRCGNPRLPSVIDGDIRHRLLLLWSFSVVHSLKGCLSGKFWEEQDVVQIEGIVVDGAVRDVALRRLFMKR